MTVPTIEVARKLAEAHRDRLLAGAPVTVAKLLLDAGRCPECAGPLLRGDSTTRCLACGLRVETTC